MGRGDFSRDGGDPQVNAAANKQIEELMNLEARRNFLRDYAAKFAAQSKTARAEQFLTAASALLVDPTREQELNVDIAQSVMELRDIQQRVPFMARAIDLVLLPKVGSDNDGISKTLAKRFGQFVAPISEPFVQLLEDGLHLYWKEGKIAEQFSNALKLHGISSETAFGGLTDVLVPESMSQLSKEERFQGENCQHVVIPHRHVEPLVALGQFHPYSCKAVVTDLYQGKFDRASLLVKDHLLHPSSTPRPHPIHITDVVRVAIPGQDDLVRVTLAADDLTTDEAATSYSHHVVILLDDSGSMNGAKMKAANAALREFIKQLPAKTLVSIQPFNAETVAYRLKVEDLQADLDNYCSTPATGGTPLIEILACSALFARKNSQDLILSEDELSRTTWALLTDGQPNGKAKDAVVAMETSQSAGHSLFLDEAINIPGVTKDNFISFGMGGFRCRLKPVVLPISVGSDSDEVFMRELAMEFHAPEVFVKTDKNMVSDIKHAMDVLMQMRGRVSAYVGLGFNGNDSFHAMGQEEQNMFFGRTRTAYYRVSPGAKDLKICTIADLSSQGHVHAGLTHLITDLATKKAVTTDYARQRLHELKMQFIAKTEGLCAGAAPVQLERSSRWATAPAPVESMPKKDEPSSAEIKFTTLKDEMLRDVKALKNICIDPLVQDEFTLFISTLEQTTLSSGVATIRPSRGDIAKFTQHRQLGEKAAVNPKAQLSGVDFIAELLSQGQYALALERLMDDPTLLNKHSVDLYASTPVITALALLSKDQTNDKLRAFIVELLTMDVNVLEVDSSNNTALHRAAWFGETELCKLIIKKMTAEQLSQVRFIRNTTKNGATLGETVISNIQRSPNLSVEDKRMLQQLIESRVTDDFQLVAEHYDSFALNQHLPEYWNTPLMEMVRLIESVKDDDEKKNFLRQKIAQLLDQHGAEIDFTASNFKGDTLLHYLIWYGEFQLALKLIEKARANGQLTDVLNAHNAKFVSKAGEQIVGGEVPHMNLAAKGKEVYEYFADFFQKIVAPMVAMRSLTSPMLINIEAGDNVLDVLLQRLMALLEIEEGPSMNSQVAGSLSVQYNLIRQVLEQYQQLKSWCALCKETVSSLTDEQQAELGHLLQVHGKELNGYNSMSFLSASPAHSLGTLIQTCMSKNIQLTSNGGPLLAKLKQVQTTCTAELIADALAWVDEKLIVLGSAKPSDQTLFAAPADYSEQDVFVRARGCLVQYQAYMQGQLSTLQQYLGDLTANFVPATEDNEPVDAFTFY